MIFLPVACEYAWLDPWGTRATIANAIVLACLVGALAGGAGAAFGRTYAGTGEEATSVRLSFSERIVAGCLVAILLVYIFLIV
jgi:hypothetical protein